MKDFILPDIGEGIVECEVVKWLVSEGQLIEEDQAVVEVMTDKALVEIPAKYSGVVTKLYYAEGNIAKVHSPLFEMRLDAQDSEPKTEHPIDTSGAQHQSVCTNQPQQTISQEPMPLKTNGKALASPAVRRLAREMDIDLASVAGSGDKGRVLKGDLQVSEPIPSHQPIATQQAGKRTEPIRGIQAAMAKHMSHSVFTVPHFTVSEEINLDRLIEARTTLKAEFDAQDIKLSFMPFFIKALSLALTEFPIINSQVNQECTEITYFDDHNIGIAVDSKVGLVVPNIKSVQNLSLMDIAQQSNTLIELARQGKLSNQDLKGGTISISNIGVLGGTVATPVINAPESAIVALGKIQRLPRFDDQDNVKAVNIMHVSWSGDHRIIDGATIVRFNNLWKSYLEEPLTMLTALR